MELFSALGFHWNRSAVPDVVPTHSIERVAFRFHRMLPEFVWDASVLEGNPFTFPEVKTLLDGVTIGGRKISDQEQVLKRNGFKCYWCSTPLTADVVLGNCQTTLPMQASKVEPNV